MSLGVRQPGRSKRKNRARALSLATLGSRDCISPSSERESNVTVFGSARWSRVGRSGKFDRHRLKALLSCLPVDVELCLEALGCWLIGEGAP